MLLTLSAMAVGQYTNIKCYGLAATFMPTGLPYRVQLGVEPYPRSLVGCVLKSQPHH